MSVFLLHGGEAEALELGRRSGVAHGAALPPDWRGYAVVRWGAAGQAGGADERRRAQAAGAAGLGEASRSQGGAFAADTGATAIAAAGAAAAAAAASSAQPTISVGGSGRGAAAPATETVWTLQPASAVRLAADRGQREPLLALHGLKTARSHAAGRPASYPYKYKVAVFHLQTLAVFERAEPVLLAAARRPAGAEAAAYREVALERATFHARRAAREAVKALYALGLDYGIVTLGVLAEGHTLVLDVEAQPRRLGERLLGLYAEALAAYAAAVRRERRRTERAMLGCDPEFLLLNPQGKVVSADRFFAREGAVGCDAVVQSGHRILLPLAELRPRPSDDPRELTGNLHRTMQLAARAIPDDSLAWLSGGMPLKGFALGGHIHFSRVQLNVHLLRALDNYLALPLLLLEGAGARGRRPRYGFLGDFRRQSHGGFEYRTPPSWLASPAIARGVLTLASLIADNYARLSVFPLQQASVQRAYYAGDKQALLGTVDALWSELALLDAYELHAAALAPLKRRMLALAAWDESADIRPAWKIAPYQTKEACAPQFVL
ncbi:hypothetical protein B5M42_000650 [Paenibacillus athensensis]|uniref:Phage phiEco32-like COOH.NH2 ligase-type 2 n=1 Tax=Paenibacillus athensensis TaxID=1967502 RepID=A0A4Y8Q759_9BACL|nr:hypothetical protein [Paenibacillus athensensis]MCD1257343.1 hypothetical protein [Paenibacillus athensensis]